MQKAINVTMMCLPDFYLKQLVSGQDTEGKEARRETRRRKMTGTYISCAEEKAEFVSIQEANQLKALAQESVAEEGVE